MLVDRLGLEPRTSECKSDVIANLTKRPFIVGEEGVEPSPSGFSVQRYRPHKLLPQMPLYSECGLTLDQYVNRRFTSHRWKSYHLQSYAITHMFFT